MRRTALTTFANTTLLFAFACDSDPAKGKTVATASAPLLVAPTSTTPQAGAAKHTFSHADSKIAFVGAKVSAKHDGAFNTFTGTVTLVDQAPEKSAVTAEIDVASITTDSEKLTRHLKSPDLLDVAQFPKATFASTSVRPGGDKGATHTVTGNFQLHGVTKSISFPATLKVAGDVVHVDAEFAINRKDFGIVYPGIPDDLIKDDVLLKLTIRAKKSPS